MSATNVAHPSRSGPLGVASRLGAPANRLGATAVGCGVAAMLLVLVPPTRALGGALTALALATGLWALRRSCRNAGQGRDAAWVAIMLSGLAVAGLVASQAVFGAAADTPVSSGGEIVAGGSASVVDPATTTRQVLTEQLGVEIGEIRLELDPSGVQRSTLPVTVTNTSDRTRSFHLEFQARDGDGQPLTTDSAYVASLDEGQSATVNVFSIVGNVLTAELAAATFSVTAATSS